MSSNSADFFVCSASAPGTDRGGLVSITLKRGTYPFLALLAERARGGWALMGLGAFNFGSVFFYLSDLIEICRASRTRPGLSSMMS